MARAVRNTPWWLRRPATVGVLGLAAGAWALSVRRMEGMGSGPSIELGTFGWFAVTWLLMMAAMMLPVLAPAVTAECWPAQRRARMRPLLVSGWFIAGYLAVWLAAGAAVYLILHFGRDLAGGWTSWSRGGHWLAAAVLFAAAVYQLTLTKRRWLDRCRRPLNQPSGNPITEPLAAGQAGLLAGGRCLGSSWALMAVLFALGVMNLGWMAVIAGLIAAERLLPAPRVARFAAAVVLLGLAIGVATTSIDAPARHGAMLPGMSMTH